VGKAIEEYALIHNREDGDFALDFGDTGRDRKIHLANLLRFRGEFQGTGKNRFKSKSIRSPHDAGFSLRVL
jgi:hypothetical protein